VISDMRTGADRLLARRSVGADVIVHERPTDPLHANDTSADQLSIRRRSLASTFNDTLSTTTSTPMRNVALPSSRFLNKNKGFKLFTPEAACRRKHSDAKDNRFHCIKPN